jgi:hypothetical protein
VRLSLRVEALLLASWEVEPAAIARVLPPNVAPTTVSGKYFVSVVALRFGGGRVGRLPVPPFSQLNVRTYVVHQDERAVFFLRSYVTLGALGGIFFGAPFRAARLRFRPGLVEAPAAGVSLRYRLAGAVDPRGFGDLEWGLFEHRGLRAFRIERGPAVWRRAEATGPVRADVLHALGFELDTEPSLLHARAALFETEVPPAPIGELAE